MAYVAHKFSKESNAEFALTLRTRVKEYFQKNNISKHANANMVIKTIFMLSLYFVPYAFLLSGNLESKSMNYLMWILMAFGMSGIGLSIMHDANHGSYSKYKWVNSSLSYLINFIGGNVINWRLQHNVLHHTYTNIHGSDEDMDGPPFLRFSPHKELKGIHKYQHYYAWFFYGLLTISWATSKDFIQLNRFKKMEFNQIPKRYNKIVWGLIAGKSFYFLYLLVLPMIFSPVSVWFTLLGFMTMHFISGIILSTIFQSAHIMPDMEFPTPTEEGKIENGFAVHQIMNTSNFAPKNPILSWYVGGLNFQVEHHLFPDICHIHYKKISKIVKETTQQFGLPYYTHSTFIGAVYQHFKMLRKLGKA